MRVCILVGLLQSRAVTFLDAASIQEGSPTPARLAAAESLVDLLSMDNSTALMHFGRKPLCGMRRGQKAPRAEGARGQKTPGV